MIEYRVSPPVDDRELSDLHHRAFGSGSTSVIPWTERLTAHSLLWVVAMDDSGAIGFVNVVGDGGAHAFILDTVVLPQRQGEGVGRRLIETAAESARSCGCQWLHVDFEPDLAEFYLDACGFRPTAAGLIRLTG
jgi:GNAT superfamily N-acetyltransferase